MTWAAPAKQLQEGQEVTAAPKKGGAAVVDKDAEKAIGPGKGSDGFRPSEAGLGGVQDVGLIIVGAAGKEPLLLEGSNEELRR